MKVGQLVVMELIKPRIYGRVAAVSEGGIVTGMRGGKPEVRNGHLLVVCNLPMEVEPGDGAHAVVACVDPEPMSDDAIARLGQAGGDKPN